MNKHVNLDIEVGPVWATLSTQSSALKLLDDKLAAWVKGAERTWAYRNGTWDGREHNLMPDGQFRSGLILQVTQFLEQAGYAVTVTDKRVRPVGAARALDIGKKPWAHQLEAIEAAVAAGQGVIYHSVGAGKTDTMAGLLDVLGLRTLLLVDQKSIAVQTAKRWQALGHKVGLWAAGSHTDGDVVVATFQTVSARLRGNLEATRRWLTTFDVLLVDEAHHLVAKTYQQIADAVPAFYRFAFSGTPFKSSSAKADDYQDKLALLHVVGTTGPVISEYRSRDGIEDKILTPPRITMFNWAGRHPSHGWDRDDFDINDNLYEYTGRKAKRGQPAQAGLYDVAVVEAKPRNRAVVDAVSVLREDNLSILVLVERTTHGYELKRLIQTEFDDDDVVAFIHGDTPQEEREAKLRALTDGTIPVLIASKIVDEGIDVPSIGALVFAAGGRAAHRYAQRVGRGMRRADGKDEVQVIDMFDTHSHTMWLQSLARKKAYEREGFKVEVIG